MGDDRLNLAGDPSDDAPPQNTGLVDKQGRLLSPKVNSKSTERKYDYHLISTIALSVISLCALIVAIQQTVVLSRQQEIMVQTAKSELWPRVGMGMTYGVLNDSITPLKLNVGNFGTGPAIVQEVSFQVGDRHIKNYEDLFNALGIKQIGVTDVGTSKINDRVIQPGEVFSFLQVDDFTLLSDAIHRSIMQNNLQVTIVYKSVFDDYWKVTTDYRTEDTQVTELTDYIPLDGNAKFRD